MGIHHRNLLPELVDVGVDVGLLVAGLVVSLITATIPAGVVVNGITDVDTLDGILGIVLIAGLPTRARHPDDAVEAIGANLVHDGLEKILLGPGRTGTTAGTEGHRLVGQLDADLAGVLEDGVILGESVPHVHQVVVVVVTHLQVAGAYATGTHHAVHTVLEGIECQGNIDTL